MQKSLEQKNPVLIKTGTANQSEDLLPYKYKKIAPASVLARNGSTCFSQVKNK